MPRIDFVYKSYVKTNTAQSNNSSNTWRPIIKYKFNHEMYHFARMSYVGFVYARQLMFIFVKIAKRVDVVNLEESR